MSEKFLVTDISLLNVLDVPKLYSKVVYQVHSLVEILITL